MRTPRAARRLGLLLAACSVPGSPGSAALGVAGRVRVVPAMGTPAVGAVGAGAALKPLSLASPGTPLSWPAALTAPGIPAAAVPAAAIPPAAIRTAFEAKLPRAQTASVTWTPARFASAESAQGLGSQSATRAEESHNALPLPTAAVADAAVSYGSAVFDGSPARGRVNPILPGALQKTAQALSRASHGMAASIRGAVPSPSGPAGAAAAAGWLAMGAALAGQFPLLEVLSGGMLVAAAMPIANFLFERYLPIVPYVSRALAGIVALPFRLGFPPEAVRRAAWTLALSLPILATAWLAWSYPPFLAIRMGLAAAALGPLPVYLFVRLTMGLFRAAGHGWSALAVASFSLSAALLILGGGILSGAKVLAAAAPLISTLGAALQPELGMGLLLGGLLPPLTLLLWSGMSHFLGILPQWVSSPFYFLAHWFKGTVPPHAAVDARILMPLILLPAAAAGIVFLASPASALIPGLLAAALLPAAQFLLHNALAGFAQAVFWAAGARSSRTDGFTLSWRMAAAIVVLTTLSAAFLMFAASALALPPAVIGLGVMLLLAFPAALALMRRSIHPLETRRPDGKIV